MLWSPDSNEKVEKMKVSCLRNCFIWIRGCGDCFEMWMGERWRCGYLDVLDVLWWICGRWVVWAFGIRGMFWGFMRCLGVSRIVSMYSRREVVGLEVWWGRTGWCCCFVGMCCIAYHLSITHPFIHRLFISCQFMTLSFLPIYPYIHSFLFFFFLSPEPVLAILILINHHVSNKLNDSILNCTKAAEVNCTSVHLPKDVIEVFEGYIGFVSWKSWEVFSWSLWMENSVEIR